jgi:hypothetical protein
LSDLGHRGTQTIPGGAAEAARLAVLPDDALTGTYSNSKGIIPWYGKLRSTSIKTRLLRVIKDKCV